MDLKSDHTACRICILLSQLWLFLPQAQGFILIAMSTAAHFVLFAEIAWPNGIRILYALAKLFHSLSMN